MYNSLRLYDEGNGVEFDRRDEDIVSPLYYASRSGFTAVVSNLIDTGADVNDNIGPSGPPLTVAAWKGHLDVVQLLLARNANVNAGGEKYRGTALQQAASGGYLEIVQFLLAQGADINNSIVGV